MGDRYTLTANAGKLKERFKIEVPEWYKPRFNAAPTQLLPVITQESEGLSLFHWAQIPDWSKDKTISTKLLVADKESLLLKSSTKIALQTRRCLIPADGYYDWKKISKKGRVAHRVTFDNKNIVGFAGIWEEFEDDKEEITHTFKIITTESNDLIKSMNHRMPAIIKQENEALWLSDGTDEMSLMDIISQYDGAKTNMYSVSPKIENINIDTPELIDPFAPADQFGNYSLFD
jgi:putative SOS response-associated peptidase YedK